VKLLVYWFFSSWNFVNFCAKCCSWNLFHVVFSFRCGLIKLILFMELVACQFLFVEFAACWFLNLWNLLYVDFYFVKLLRWFLSLWNWFCSWNIRHVDYFFWELVTFWLLFFKLVRVVFSLRKNFELTFFSSENDGTCSNLT